MIRSKLVKSTLLVAGLVAIGIGGAILSMPEAFYANYGITLGPDANLMNEIRAPGGTLLGTGLLMLLGVFVPSLSLASLLVAATVYLSYGTSRLLSMIVDGVPDDGLVAASGLELAIGLLCLAALLRMRQTA